MIYRLKYIVVSFNYMIKNLPEKDPWPWRLRSHVEFSATSLSERSLFKPLLLQLTMREDGKGKVELLIDSFFKEYFLPQAQIKFHALKFLWFQGYSLACISCLSWAHCFKLPYLHDKSWFFKSRLKHLDTYLLNIFFFSCPIISPSVGAWLVLSINHKWSWKHESFLVKLINTDEQKMPQVAAWILLDLKFESSELDNYWISISGFCCQYWLTTWLLSQPFILCCF